MIRIEKPSSLNVEKGDIALCNGLEFEKLETDEANSPRVIVRIGRLPEGDDSNETTTHSFVVKGGGLNEIVTGCSGGLIVDLIVYSGVNGVPFNIPIRSQIASIVHGPAYGDVESPSILATTNEARERDDKYGKYSVLFGYILRIMQEGT